MAQAQLNYSKKSWKNSSSLKNSSIFKIPLDIHILYTLLARQKFSPPS
jgi:hypothetical protein